MDKTSKSTSPCLPGGASMQLPDGSWICSTPQEIDCAPPLERLCTNSYACVCVGPRPEAMCEMRVIYPAGNPAAVLQPAASTDWRCDEGAELALAVMLARLMQSWR